jgi:predicted ester cyclase
MQNCQERVVTLYAAFDRGEFELVRSMMAEDFKADLVGLPQPFDRSGFIEFGRQFCEAFPDSCHRFDEIIVDGDRVITIGKIFGTHLGQFQGLPATGKKIEVEFTHLDRVVDDRVCYHWGQGNQLGMMQQLGIAFLPGLSLFTAAIRHRLTSKKTGG